MGVKVGKLLFFLLLLPNQLLAQSDGVDLDSGSAPEIQLPPVQIFGSEPKDLLSPTGPKKVSKQKLQDLQLQDVNKALKQTAGAYSREEDAEGLRPNIGLRGTSPDRSKKIVLMQDEVLIGPAPYAAPAAYYTPSMVHTSGLEIYKGFAALPYGPNSVGGAINYLSSEIPIEKKSKLNLSSGSYRLGKLILSHGQQIGRTGYLLELSRLQSDGFKTLPNHQKTGFAQNQALIKISQDLNSGGKIFLTLGYGDESSQETYLGLTSGDFQANPYQRYLGSEQDEMRWKHTRAQLKAVQPLDQNRWLELTLYCHDFRRAWYRLDRFGNSSIKLRDVINDPVTNQPYYDILRGANDSSSLTGQNGDLIVLNNDRSYFSHGLQTKFSLQSEFSHSKNSFDLGVRLHQDQIRRDHSSDNYQVLSGRLLRSTDPRQRVDLNRETAQATTVFLLNNLKVQDWVFTFGARSESVQFLAENDLTGTRTRRSDNFVVPGAGVTKKIGDHYSVRASLNQAATVAGLSADGSEKRESSVNQEIEIKYLNLQSQVEADLTVFQNKYDNLTGTCSQSSGCTGAQLDQQFNGGKALIRGFEGRAGAQFAGWGFQFPVQVNLTWLQAQFSNSFVSSSEEWGLGTVREGDPLPYVPDLQYSLLLGLARGAWKQDLTLSYTGRSFDQSVSGGKVISAYGVIDWSGSYKWDQNLQLTAKADNLLANKYSVSYRPYGLRPGKPQSFQVGLVYDF